jgi:replicative DNA helicase
MAELASKTHSVLFVSLEMSITEISARRVAHKSGVGIGAVLHKPDLTPQQWNDMTTASGILYEHHLTINRCTTASVSEIGIMARSAKAELVVIDYLGLIRYTGKETNSYERITRISMDLKRLARSLNVPILCLAQLNRQSESRLDKKPALSDLRDSGAIEQDADGVLLLNRPALNWDDSQKPKSWESQPFEVYVAKNRHGPIGGVTLNWYASNGRFVDKGTNSWQ